MQPSCMRSVSRLGIPGSIVFYSMMIWFCFSSTESGLQGALNSFAGARDTAGMKISMAKTEIFHLSRNLDQCFLLVNGATLKQVEKFVQNRMG